MPEADLLVVGGPDPHDLAADPEARRLRELAGRLGVADRVRFHGRAPHDALPGIIAASDLVVAAPQYEPFGIVPLEAMACGVPVVGTAVGGLLDSVADGVTGLLVPPNDPEALAAAIRELIAEPAARAAMGAAGIERARTRFSWPRVAELTESAYRTALSDHRANALAPSAMEAMR